MNDWNNQLGDIDQQLRDINKRQRLNDERNRNGGYTNNEILLGTIFHRFRRMGRVGRLITVAVVLAVAWWIFGAGIIEAIHSTQH